MNNSKNKRQEVPDKSKRLLGAEVKLKKFKKFKNKKENN